MTCPSERYRDENEFVVLCKPKMVLLFGAFDKLKQMYQLFPNLNQYLSSQATDVMYERQVSILRRLKSLMRN